MRPELIALLLCPSCAASRLELSVISADDNGDIREGIVVCMSCRRWYPITSYVLELLADGLAYKDDRKRFWRKHHKRFGLQADASRRSPTTREKLANHQQAHFDWYAKNGVQTYADYELTTFWKSVDRIIFDKWKRLIRPHSWLLDVGCAQGRSSFKVLDLPINVVGFDISKSMIAQAIKKYRKGKFAGSAMFFVAEGTRLPFRSGVFDCVLGYGVLHHFPDPRQTSQEIARVLRPKTGIYFGLENNKTGVRLLFDFLQRVKPLWYEEAGPHPVISKVTYQSWFAGTRLGLSFRTRVFFPPHIANLLPFPVSHAILSRTDEIGALIPWVRSQGGLIEVIGMDRPILLRFAALSKAKGEKAD